MALAPYVWTRKVLYMSNRGRRHLISINWMVLMFFLLGAGIIWLSPWWMDTFFPSIFVDSQKPWDLTVADLTWQRSLTNVVHKPGFRMGILITYGLGIGLVRWMSILISRRSSSHLMKWKEMLTSMWGRDSGEFVVDGRRASLLVEFAREVRAV